MKPDLWPTAHSNLLIRLTKKKIFDFAQANNWDWYDEWRRLYRAVTKNVSDSPRMEIIEYIRDSLSMSPRAMALFYGIAFEESAPHIMTTAAMNAALYVATSNEDPLTGPKMLRTVASDASVPMHTRAGFLSALLLLGDRRTLPLLEGCWSLLDKQGREQLATTRSQFAFASMIEFYLSWAEVAIQGDDESLAAIAATLAAIPLSVNKIQDIERVFPVWKAGEIVHTRVIQEWSIAEYSSHFVPRIKALAAREAEPKVLPLVLSHWDEARIHRSVIDFDIAMAQEPANASIRAVDRQRQAEYRDPPTGANKAFPSNGSMSVERSNLEMMGAMAQELRFSALPTEQCSQCGESLDTELGGTLCPKCHDQSMVEIASLMGVQEIWDENWANNYPTEDHVIWDVIQRTFDRKSPGESIGDVYSIIDELVLAETLTSGQSQSGRYAVQRVKLPYDQSGRTWRIRWNERSSAILIDQANVSDYESDATATVDPAQHRAKSHKQSTEAAKPRKIASSIKTIQFSLPHSMVQNEIIYWMTSLRDERRKALNSPDRADYALAQWEQSMIDPLISNLRTQVAKENVRGPDHQISLEITPVDLSFLTHVSSYALRRSRSAGSSPREARVLSRHQKLLWEHMKEGTPHFFVLPYGMIENLLIAPLELATHHNAVGQAHSNDKQGRLPDEYRATLSRCLKAYDANYGEQAKNYWVVVPSKVREVNLVATAIAAVVDTTREHERQYAQEALRFVTQFLDPVAAEQLRNQTSSQSQIQQREINKATSASSSVSGASFGLTQYPAVSMVCVRCGFSFVSTEPWCPNCDPFFDAALDELKSQSSPDASELEAALDKGRIVPDALPVLAAIIAGIVALIAGFIVAQIQYRTDYSLIVVFPSLIGAAAGAATAIVMIRRSIFLRSYYWIIPIGIAIVGYASTFWFEYQIFVSDAQNAGIPDITSLVSFTDYWRTMARVPFSLGRIGRSSETEVRSGDPSDAYVLWGIEAVIAGFAGFWAWKKVIRMNSLHDDSDDA